MKEYILGILNSEHETEIVTIKTNEKINVDYARDILYIGESKIIFNEISYLKSMKIGEK